jgi:hypothetical protein
VAAVDGRHVIGVDPAPAMLVVARRQPVADRVHWVDGDASVLGSPEADLVIMSSNVAQVFLNEAEWAATLRVIRVPEDTLPSRAATPTTALGNDGHAPPPTSGSTHPHHPHMSPDWKGSGLAHCVS